MNIPRILVIEGLEKGAELVLSQSSSFHILKVLRKETGSKLELFDGQGRSFLSEIVSTRNKKIFIKVIGNENFQEKQGLKIKLALALIKSNAFDYAVQKCVELGVDEIIPVVTERSNFRMNNKNILSKENRWNMIAQGACEQCGQDWLPKVKKITQLKDWSRTIESGQKFVFFPGSSNKLSEVKLEGEVNIAIGPEGDFTTSELEELNLNGFISLSLGKRILRAETAAIASISALRVIAGEF